MLLKVLAVCIYLVTCDANQCSYVTVPVCGDDVTISPGSLGAPRGAKGDQGYPGKAGPRGLPGSTGLKGERGEVGSGDKKALDEIWAKVRELERTVTSLLPTSCANSRINGTTTLRSAGEVYCDNGWTVFQRRFNGSVDFYRNWTEYKNGFGRLSGEFWLGLEKIHRLTSDKQCRLRIELYDFNNVHKYAEYSSFAVGNEASNYTLLVAGYNGTAGDSLLDLSGMQFSTKDRDNDRDIGQCSIQYIGAWWFDKCFFSNLNGEWGRSSGYATKIVWYAWKGFDEALKASTMKLRCD